MSVGRRECMGGFTFIAFTKPQEFPRLHGGRPYKPITYEKD